MRRRRLADRRARSRRAGASVGAAIATIAKFDVTSGEDTITNLHVGYRVVGNRLSTPTASAPEGTVSGVGSHMAVLGNEFTRCGAPGCSKRYHPLYISSPRTFRRAPADRDGPRHHGGATAGTRGATSTRERPPPAAATRPVAATAAARIRGARIRAGAGAATRLAPLTPA